MNKTHTLTPITITNITDLINDAKSHNLKFFGEKIGGKLNELMNKEPNMYEWLIHILENRVKIKKIDKGCKLPKSKNISNMYDTCVGDCGGGLGKYNCLDTLNIFNLIENNSIEQIIELLKLDSIFGFLLNGNMVDFSNIKNNTEGTISDTLIDELLKNNIDDFKELNINEYDIIIETIYGLISIPLDQSKFNKFPINSPMKVKINDLSSLDYTKKYQSIQDFIKESVGEALIGLDFKEI